MRRRRLTTLALVVSIGIGCWWALHFEPTSPAERSSPAVENRRETVEHKRVERAPRHEHADEEATKSDANAGVTLTVRVVVKIEGDPVAGARVVAVDDDSHAHEATTDAAGVARIAQILGDYARITATAPGFARGTALATKDELHAGETIDVRVEPAVSIDGVVREESSGLGIAGARIEIDGPHDPIACAVAAADGTFHMDGAPANRKYRDDDGGTKAGVSLWAYEPHHVTTFGRWHPSDVAPVDIRMSPAGVLRGRVTDPTGAPASSAEVKATPSAKIDHEELPYIANNTAETDADGRYVLDGLPLGLKWRVVASKPTFADSAACEDVILEPGRTDAIRDFALRSPANVVVRALRSNGVPAAGAKVRLVFANGSGAGRIADSDGWCEFEVRDPSACLLCGEDGDFVATPVEFELAPGDRRTLDVVFQAGAALAGVVVDDVGTPVARAALSARGRRLGRVQDWSHDAVSAADGTFRIRGLAPGEFLVDVKGAEGHDQLSSVPATVPAADARFVLRRDGSVSFRLRVPSGAKPVEACFVSHVPIGHRGEISMMSRLTQATDGSFRVPASAGAWRFSVTVMGYLQIRRELDVAPGADTSLGEIVLDPGLTLEGRVVDTEGRLVADASVAQAGTFSVEGLRARREFRSKLGIELATEDTDAPGTFRFEHVAPGKLTVVASAEGYAPETVSLDVAAGSPPLVITLHRGGVLRGTIRDSVGKPITDVDVEVKVGDSPATWLTLDKSGAFSRRVLDGRARLVVRRGGTTLATREVDVREGEETSVEITLER